MPGHHDIEASRQGTEGADADGAGAAQPGFVVRSNADRIDVAEPVDLNGAEDGEIEEVDLPVDEIDHLRQVHHRLAPGDILGAGGRADHRLVAVDHAAGARDPPQGGCLPDAGEIAGRDLNVTVGADDRLFAIAQVARQQHRLQFRHRTIGWGHFGFFT